MSLHCKKITSDILDEHLLVKADACVDTSITECLCSLHVLQSEDGMLEDQPCGREGEESGNLSEPVCI